MILLKIIFFQIQDFSISYSLYRQKQTLTCSLGMQNVSKLLSQIYSTSWQLRLWKFVFAERRSVDYPIE